MQVNLLKPRRGSQTLSKVRHKYSPARTTRLGRASAPSVYSHSLIRDADDDDERTGFNEPPSPNDGCEEPSPKRARINDDEPDSDFKRWREQFLRVEPPSGRDEVDEYLRSYTKTPSPDIRWWLAHVVCLPRLQLAARCLLAIPATSVPIERVWNSAHNASAARSRAALPEDATLKQRLVVAYNKRYLDGSSV